MRRTTHGLKPRRPRHCRETSYAGDAVPASDKLACFHFKTQAAGIEPAHAGLKAGWFAMNLNLHGD